jgi:hypothetical protein
MKNIIVLIAFTLFAGTHTVSAQEGNKTATKKESCCVSTKVCSSEEKAKCMADASCSAADKAKCAAHGKVKAPAKKRKAKA